MKVSIKQLAKLLMEEKTVLATHHGGEEGTEGYEKDVLSRSWGDDEEADPKLDFVDEARFAEIAGIQEQSMRRPMTAEADALEFAMDEYIKTRVADGEDDPSRLHREMVAIADQLINDADLSGAFDTSRY